MSEQAASNSNANATNTDANNENQKPEEKKPDFMESKIFRLICVGLYLAGVSGLGMTISFYHLFFWDSKMPEMHLTHQHNG